ncbi:MAG: transketolase [Kiritimatiellaeota bacterium]|nr:transketolase [Kiritimatiellota bacterium]
MTDTQLLRRAADTVRILSADGVQEANSGHPGMPMGCADFAFLLWYKFLRHNPDDPDWLGRDRFVLSAGHGSTLLYSLLHLFEYEMPLAELKRFRQWGSLTPGHPEHGHTPGVEVTTGPLGSGFVTAVGMAMAAKQLAARMGEDELFDQRMFVLSSDGCMMEGCTHEAASLAGHLELDNLVVFYDDNRITIEGSTALAFSEDVGKRFEAYGWHVQHIDGQDARQIDAALAEAVACATKPSLIVGRTTIGYGAPNLAGSHKTHGAPLGAEEMAALRRNLGFPDQPFHVPREVREMCHGRAEELRAEARAWNARLKTFRGAQPEKAGLLDRLLARQVPENILDELLSAIPDKPTATRSSGGAVMQRVAALVPAFCGGAADLAPSTKTYLTDEADFTATERAGRNFHYGVREFCMGLCSNGMALYGTVLPFAATFTVFSDFMKPALRLAALQELPVVFVFTHDSIFVGEDGPTHQPIEHLDMCRSIPGLTVIRPAESHEVAHAWAAALQHAEGPVALFLTRQTVRNFSPDQAARIDLARGAYVLSEDHDFELVLIATGSEVSLALEAAALLRRDGIAVRLVSMPSWELFDRQDKAYRDAVLPPDCRKRVAVEAGTTFGWERYVGLDGLTLGVDRFGDSAPAKILAEKYGFTPESVAARVRRYLGRA